ncbi:hypothetical protein [Bacillus sp. S/N-304-OC-R1]|uniref:hypothetical protein n=1 Tax=Bacillus sp. S/N-304-OC-R1 TaxID=2758034 RepID=UPI001C8D4AB3|nr:hypothetical protein [Bacillus sp. S/N-304-OC-R1]MBY0123895.1 hypothetical protein [Bacillus sp. S/N-304-OC-R1]
MGKWNEQAAPNNNMTAVEIKSSKLIKNKPDFEFSEELSDGGERNERFNKPRYNKK